MNLTLSEGLDSRAGEERGFIWYFEVIISLLVLVMSVECSGLIIMGYEEAPR